MVASATLLPSSYLSCATIGQFFPSSIALSIIDRARMMFFFTWGKSSWKIQIITYQRLLDQPWHQPSLTQFCRVCTILGLRRSAILGINGSKKYFLTSLIKCVFVFDIVCWIKCVEQSTHVYKYYLALGGFFVFWDKRLCNNRLTATIGANRAEKERQGDIGLFSRL